MENNARAYQEALFNNEHAGLIYVELLALAAGIGFYFFSLKVFLGAFLATLFILKFRYTRIAVFYIFNVAWGFVGFMIGVEHSVHAGIILAIIIYVIISRMHRVDNSWI